MECLLHRDSRSSKEEVVPFTEFTFAKVQECCKAWKMTVSAQEIAIANDFECAVLERVEYYGYHLNCYNQFTRKSRIAKARLEARQATAKRLRPPSAVVACKEVPEDVFPRECIFCRAVGKATLTRCRRPETASKIQAAAIERKDQRMLDQIVGKDLVACQIVYHNKCYTRYTMASHLIAEVKSLVLDDEAFRHFVADVAKEEREGRSCVPMTALANLFVNTAVEDGGGGELRAKVAQQTAALKKHCPYRTFAGGKFGSNSETRAVPWEFGSLDGAALRNNGRAVAGEDAGDSHNHRDDYSQFAQQFALRLHEKMKSGSRSSGPAPPELPIFLAWCTGETDGSPRVLERMPRERRDRIVAIAKDIVALTAEHTVRWK